MSLLKSLFSGFWEDEEDNDDNDDLEVGLIKRSKGKKLSDKKLEIIWAGIQNSFLVDNSGQEKSATVKVNFLVDHEIDLDSLEVFLKKQIVENGGKISHIRLSTNLVDSVLEISIKGVNQKILAVDTPVSVIPIDVPRYNATHGRNKDQIETALLRAIEEEIGTNNSKKPLNFHELSDNPVIIEFNRVITPHELKIIREYFSPGNTSCIINFLKVSLDNTSVLSLSFIHGRTNETQNLLSTEAQQSIPIGVDDQIYPYRVVEQQQVFSSENLPDEVNIGSTILPLEIQPQPRQEEEKKPQKHLFSFLTNNSGR